jgi:hypothetical protein
MLSYNKKPFPKHKASEKVFSGWVQRFSIAKKMAIENRLTRLPGYFYRFSLIIQRDIGFFT